MSRLDPPLMATVQPKWRYVLYRGSRLLFVVLVLSLLILGLGTGIYGAMILLGWWQAIPPEIIITFQQGHYLKPRDPLVYRGTVLGQVQSVDYDFQKQEVVVRVRLNEGAEFVASEGSLFWIERPQIHITEIAGLDSLLQRRLAVLPLKQGPPASFFVGLEEPPIFDKLTQPGGQEVVIRTTDARGIHRNTPVYYRHQQVGSVSEIRLSDDNTLVLITVYIRPQYTSLLREHTVFWNASGFRLRAGFSGLLPEFDWSFYGMETLLRTGIALAVPNQPGAAVSAGHDYLLLDKPPPDVESWQPPLASDTAGLPPSFAPTTLIQVHLEYEIPGWIWNTPDKDAPSGWGVVTSGGVVLPSALVYVPRNRVKPTLKLAGSILSQEVVIQEKELRAAEPVGTGLHVIKIDLPVPPDTTLLKLDEFVPLTKPQGIWLCRPSTATQNESVYLSKERLHPQANTGDTLKIDLPESVRNDSREWLGALIFASHQPQPCGILTKMVTADDTTWFIGVPTNH
ncbi:MAG: hypothetical protein KatS3mg113_1011 [Planctomycetaceae bacterium]|nr:MAG: hypothetical protein KatS3mg113_1011 [Planctomycetaceae bacterium]